ncbi:MAG: hypothetical protein Q7R52_00515 [archaeon]|nr:hypothetical protein [archaeon]
MVKGLKKENLKGKNFALTILLGIFIAIMVSVLFNLIVSYAYEQPTYDELCKNTNNFGAYPMKYGLGNEQCGNCTFSKTLQEETDKCIKDGGITIYNYDDKGCTTSVKECNMCNKEFEDAIAQYNKNTFFVFAAIGFILIIVGLYTKPLLIQISTLPAGAFLVIEAAVKNFNDKLLIIIVFSLLIIAAVVLALRKLK